ncbi:MAG: SpoIIE family protein phosphatase [Acidobacteria bacterium]|nr:SpoIIE family protein phosphatase [Acidobacteriota bacterium]
MTPAAGAEPPEPGASGAAYFTVINPSGHTKRVEISAGPFTIGRQGENNLVLRDNRVSRVHARLEREAADLYVADCQSLHGTFVNGERVEGRRRLRPHDRITFGFDDGYQVVFQQGSGQLTGLAGQVSGLAGQASGAMESLPGMGANLAKLRSLLEVARAVQSALSTQEILDSVVDAALSLTGSERGFLLLRPGSYGVSPAETKPVAEGSELEIRVARDRHGNPLPETALRVPRRVIERALRDRRDLLSMQFDPEAASGLGAEQSIAALELRSVVCVPLVKMRTEVKEGTMAARLADTVGLLYLDSRTMAADLSMGNRELLQTLAIEASTVLENARLLEQDRLRQRMEQELEIARQIQQGLLPGEFPATASLRVAGSSISTHQVGGDFYDLIPLAGGAWAMVVADVSGKGVSSALLASLLQGAFLQAPRTPEEIRERLGALNRYLLDRTRGEKYATLFYMVVEQDGTMHWANAGHCEPRLLRREGSVERLRATSLPVGMIDGVDFGAETRRLEKGDTIVVFSDGLSEAESPRGDNFEASRLKTLLAQGAGLEAAVLHQRILEDAQAFTAGLEQLDDMTLVVARFQPEA